MDYLSSSGEGGAPAAAVECLAVAAAAVVEEEEEGVQPLLCPQSLPDAVTRSGVETHSSGGHENHLIVKMALMESLDSTTYFDCTVT